jgi:hypothetical protein
MPTVFIHKGYRVSFYSYDLAEPVHVHVFKAGRECKVWMADMSIAFNRGFREHDLSEIRELLAARRQDILQKWQEHERNR